MAIKLWRQSSPAAPQPPHRLLRLFGGNLDELFPAANAAERWWLVHACKVYPDTPTVGIPMMYVDSVARKLDELGLAVCDFDRKALGHVGLKSVGAT